MYIKDNKFIITYNNNLHEVIYLISFKAMSYHNNNYHLLSTYYVSVTWLNALYTFFH